MSRGALKTIMALRIYLWWLSTFLIWLHTLFSYGGLGDDM